MSSLVAEANVWTNTMTVPDDGDTSSAASITAAGVGFQVAADRTRYLYNRLMAASGGNMLIPMSPLPQNNAATRFDTAVTAVAGELGSLRQYSIASAGRMVFPVPMLTGATFTTIVAIVHGDPTAAGPRAGLPATVPLLSLYKTTLSTGTNALVGSQADPVAGVAGYEALHTITLTVAAQSFGGDANYSVHFEGETGANSLANGLHLYGMYMIVVP